MLEAVKGKRISEYVSDYVVFDLETTGTSATTDDVVEISAVKVCKGNVVDEFSTLVNPQRAIPFYASQVNGITDDMVIDAPVFEEALKSFLEFAEDAVLVGHNIHTFDMKFIYRDAEKYWGKTISNNYIDTLSLARRRLPKLEHHKLVDLAEHYGVSSEGAHRALNDCRMNQVVYEKLMQESETPDTTGLKICPCCGLRMREKSGRYGGFWGCSGYPECRYTENM